MIAKCFKLNLVEIAWVELFSLLTNSVENLIPPQQIQFYLEIISTDSSDAKWVICMRFLLSADFAIDELF